MPNLIPSVNVNSPHPIFSNEAEIKRFFLDLANAQPNKHLRSIVKKSATFIRRQIEGYSAREIRAKLIDVLEDYFDGEIYVPERVETVIEEAGLTKYAAKTLTIIQKMIEEKILETRGERSWQEAGEHYKDLIRLKGKQ